MKSFDDLFLVHLWTPIRGCPGRFVLRGGPCRISPQEMIGNVPTLREYRSIKATDTIIAGRIEGGGLISYRKNDGRYIHTLNDIDGFERKLSQLGIACQFTHGCQEGSP
jgi:hypothetical protein